MTTPFIAKKTSLQMEAIAIYGEHIRGLLLPVRSRVYCGRLAYIYSAITAKLRPIIGVTRRKSRRRETQQYCGACTRFIGHCEFIGSKYLYEEDDRAPHTNLTVVGVLWLARVLRLLMGATCLKLQCNSSTKSRSLDDSNIRTKRS
jgi:hypothetical protein